MKRFRRLTQHPSLRWRTGFGNQLFRSCKTLLQQGLLQLRRQLSTSEKLPLAEKLTLYFKQLIPLILAAHLVKRKSRATPAAQRIMLLLVALFLLTTAIGYRFYNEPQLAVGTIAPQTIRAPEAARVVDTKTTDEKRLAARTGANPVLSIDAVVNQEIHQALQQLLEEGSGLRQEAGPFPFVRTSALSSLAQQYVRRAPTDEWMRILATVEGKGPANNLFRSPQAGAPAPGLNPANEPNPYRQLVLIELQNYRRATSPEDLAALKQVIGRARQRYEMAIALLDSPSADGSIGFYDTSVFDLTDAEWNQMRVSVRQGLERILLQGVAPGLPPSLLETAVRAQMNASSIPPAGESLAVRIVMAVLRPNLIEDVEQTRLLAEQAAQAVKPEVVKVREDEIIVRTGETITQRDFVVLDHFKLSNRSVNWSGLIGFAALMSGAIALFLVVEHRFHPGLRRRDYILVLLFSLTAPLVAALKIPATSLPLIGLLVGSFYGSALGMTTVGLLSITLPIGMEINLTNLISSAIASLVGARLAGQSRSREELAMLSGSVGLIQGLIYLFLNLLISTPDVWYTVLTTAAIQGAMGIAWGVVALGLSPYLENLFDLITPVRLAELSNPNRPLLKRLASEAPGTFQHTLFVASLAEAAARALGCNVELVRAGTLYHDIGKMHDAMGFIENQMGGPNKHDQINDPWVSADIIKKHVTEGLVMARKYRLPKAIRAFIPEHQGTMLIAYFFHEAQKRSQEDPMLTLNEADFRYNGPIPQTRETGIVMLADSCEAALRSLKEATPEDALIMINRILRARWQDGQMADCGLTRADMGTIAEVFVKVWQQFNHQRIAYPKLSPTPQPPIPASVTNP